MRINYEGIIPIVGGVYFLLLAYRVVPGGKETDAWEQWILKYGRMMKMLCPFVILFGLATFFGLLR